VSRQPRALHALYLGPTPQAISGRLPASSAGLAVGGEIRLRPVGLILVETVLRSCPLGSPDHSIHCLLIILESSTEKNNTTRSARKHLKQLEHKTTTLWSPFSEWRISSATQVPDPFAVDARAVFTHTETGEQLTTGLFPSGDNEWAFRFANSRTGHWTCKTESEIPDLGGWTTIIDVEPDNSARGTISHIGHWWAWSESGEVFVPQLAMYDSPEGFLDQPEKIETDIKTLLSDHGFNGFHVPVFCRWFDIDKETNPEFDDPDPLPDPRTFDALELLIQKTYAAGGMVHLWMWGDNDADHRMTPMRDDWGGKNGRVVSRLLKYVAARLAPVIGWTMGYGFDLEHWVAEEDLRQWHETLTEAMSWPHLLGGRSGRPKDDPELLQIYDGLDYAGYTHLRPKYEDYVTAIKRHPDKPVFSEDRFRIRESERFAFKDYTEEATRRGLWDSTMAGGVANIWGMMAKGERNGRSVSYPNADHLQTCAKFFKVRLKAGMQIDNSLTDGCCLRNQDKSVLLFYKESTDALEIEVTNASENLRAILVDACAPYVETPIEITAGRQVIRCPKSSDWAVCVEGRG